MTSKATIGIIGAGMWGQQHAEIFQNNPRSTVGWMIDFQQELLTTVAQKFGIEKTGSKISEMLEDPQVDLVVIATPSHTHVPIARQVIAAGKNVLVEKPLALTASEASELMELSQQHPELLICSASSRHSRINPKYTQIKAFIDGGSIGDVYYIHHRAVSRQSRAGIEYNPGAKWFLDKKLSGGGPLFDWGVYDLAFHLER